MVANLFLNIPFCHSQVLPFCLTIWIKTFTTIDSCSFHAFTPPCTYKREPPFCLIFLMIIFTTKGADPKVNGTIESSSLRHFFWHVAKFDQTYCYGNINCWEHSGTAAAAGVQYDSKVLMWCHIKPGQSITRSAPDVKNRKYRNCRIFKYWRTIRSWDQPRIGYKHCEASLTQVQLRIRGLIAPGFNLMCWSCGSSVVKRIAFSFKTSLLLLKSLLLYIKWKEIALFSKFETLTPHIQGPWSFNISYLL